MAKAKESKSTVSKNAKSGGGRIPAPTANRRPARVAPDAPSSEVIQTGAAAGLGRPQMSPEEVYKLIQEAAYYKAKARGFAPGHEVQDWIEAEAEVRLRLENRA